VTADLEPYQAPTTPALRAGALDYPTMLQLGAAFAASGLFPGVKDQGVAVVKILAGAEMGLEPVAAMNGIDIIAMPGRPPRMRPNADVQALLARRAGYDFTPIEHTAEKCVLEWRHNGKVLGTSEFSVSQARTARLVRDGGAWQAWPENMTLARAITQGVKLFCRHILAGSVGGMQIVTTDELEQEYPDPREDCMRALFATLREKLPRDKGESKEDYDRVRHEWATRVLGRPVSTFNGPEGPETLTRNDVSILLDAAEAIVTAEVVDDDEDTQPAPARELATPVSPGTSLPGAESMQGSAGREAGHSFPASPGGLTPVVVPAEHHTAEVLGEVAPADGTAPGGPSRSDTGQPSGPAPTPEEFFAKVEGAAVQALVGRPAPTPRKRRKTDPTGAPGAAEAIKAAQQFRDERKAQTEVERSGWLEDLPPEAVYNLMTYFQDTENPEQVSESVVRVFARRNGLEKGTEWTAEQIDKLAAETWRKQ
jgi:hypothetical protein